jgi:transcription elongation factor Elf1
MLSQQQSQQRADQSHVSVVDMCMDFHQQRQVQTMPSSPHFHQHEQDELPTEDEAAAAALRDMYPNTSVSLHHSPVTHGVTNSEDWLTLLNITAGSTEPDFAQQHQQHLYNMANLQVQRLSTAPASEMSCLNCKTTSTPIWRRFTMAHNGTMVNLCDSCGLYYRQHNRHRTIGNGMPLEVAPPEFMLAHPDKAPPSKDPPKKRRRTPAREDLQCANCGCNKTPLWRKNSLGEILCNACGLYFKSHNQHKRLDSQRGCGSSSSTKILASPPSPSSDESQVQNWVKSSLQAQVKSLEDIEGVLKRTDVFEMNGWNEISEMARNLSKQVNDIVGMFLQ